MINRIFSIRLDKATRAMLERLALNEERTRGDVVTRLIRNAAQQLPTLPSGGATAKENTHHERQATP